MSVRSLRWIAGFLAILGGVGLSAPAVRGATPAGTTQAPIDSLARPSVERGIVWTPPERPRPARHALREMHRRGVTAVRVTRPVADRTVLALADSLHLRLFVDLPVGALSARALRDSADALTRHVDAVLALAQQHPSVRGVGFGSPVDTTVPAACDVVQGVTDRVHATDPAGLQTYYVTPFDAPSDRCTRAVDRVLLDVRDAVDPVARWRGWIDTVDNGADADRVSSRVGIGALGTWVRPGAPEGRRVPHSPQRQARHLETTLTTLLDTTRATPPVVFVYRWSDRPPSTTPLSRRYGLLSDTGTVRPAAHVVAGLYTGRQTVFAFPQGTSPSAPVPWLLLLAWTIVAALGVSYARLPAFRRMTARYFVAHGFYRDALAEGREPMLDVSLLLWAIVVAAAGIVTTVAGEIVAPLSTTSLVLDALPPAVQAPVARWVETPAAAGIGAGAALAVGLGVWMVVLFGLSRRGTPLAPSQTLMLVVWPCWPVLLLLVAALVALSLPASGAATALACILIGVGIVAIAVTARVTRDFTVVAAVPLGIAVASTLASPLVLLTPLVLPPLYRHDVPLSLVWHLITRT